MDFHCRRESVRHDCKEWTGDNDNDDVFEVHTHSVEGLWTGLRNFRRAFRGLSKHFLSGYVALHEFCVSRKRISPASICVLGAVHSL